MRMYDNIDAYSAPRRFPWLPLAVALVALAGAVSWVRSCHAERRAADADGDAEAEPVAAEAAATGADAASAASAQQQLPSGAAPATAGNASSSSASASPASADTASALPSPDPANALTAAQIEPLLAQCRKLEEEGALEAAREKYLEILPRAAGAIRPRIEADIGRLGIELVTTPRPMKGKVVYKIRSGDSLSSIAAKHNCPVLLIQKANDIKDPLRIRPGNTILVLDQPKFSVEVSKTQNTLTLLLDGEFFKTYTVGTGANARTPVGTFRISEKIESPPWWPGDGRSSIPFGDPENILGTHWLAIEATGSTPQMRGYGIHGTWDDSSLGKQSSAGCVRMKNSDVAEVFMLLPRGTPVTIREN